MPWTEQERMSFEKELLGFYVTGHPLDAYAGSIARGGYQTIASLGEMADRASFRVAGAITQVDKKFTKKEGKPFAVVFLEDLTGTLEVVVWNEVYVKIAEALSPGRVIAIQGTLEKRDEAVRATAQKVKLFAPDAKGEATIEIPVVGEPVVEYCSSVVLRFPCGTPTAELRKVRELLASSPGSSEVFLEFEQGQAKPLRVQAGRDCHVALTPELESKLAPWLAQA